MKTHAVTLHFEKGYIAHPYWPELEKLINIQKESGTKRARSEARRLQALKDYLAAKGMTLAEYEALEKLAARPFYTNAAGAILVPAHQPYGCLAQACDLGTAAVRLTTLDQLRTVLTLTDFVTDRVKADGAWERFVVVTSGAGGKLSNQRALRRNEYIADFAAEGTVRVLDSVDPARLLRFLEYAGREIGVGASRKLGWGRFTVTLA